MPHPAEAVSAPLASGALVEVMADWSHPIAGDFLYYPSRRTLSPAMRTLVERLRYRGDDTAWLTYKPHARADQQ